MYLLFAPQEKLMLAIEQEILREHTRAARAVANLNQPLSVCTILCEEEIYNLQELEQVLPGLQPPVQLQWTAISIVLLSHLLILISFHSFPPTTQPALSLSLSLSVL